MTINKIKEDIAGSTTSVLSERYALYKDLQSMSITDVIVRDLIELELASRGVFDDIGPYSTINS